MTKIPVLEDNTLDAYQIGVAETVEEAGDVFMAYMRERMEPDDFATLARPQFVRRMAGRDDGPKEFRESAVFEPIT